MTCFSLIVNLSNEDEPGTHFVAIIVHNNVMIYFDSLALTNIFFFNYVKKMLCQKRNMQYLVNRKPIQCSTSNFCGFFCIYSVLLFHNLSSCEMRHELTSNYSHLTLREIINEKVQIVVEGAREIKQFFSDSKLLIVNDYYVIHNIHVLLSFLL